MNAKKYLQQIEKLDAMIEDRMDRLEHWKTIATKTTTSAMTIRIGEEMHGIEKVQSSGKKDSMADAICEMVDLESIYADEIKSIADQKEEIIKTLELLPAKEYKLLYKIYVGKIIEKFIGGEKVKTIEYLTLDEAAAEMGMSRRWANSTHGRGLAKVQKILDEREGR